MDDELERRIETLERAVTDGDHDLAALADEAEAAERLDAVESRLDDIEDRVAELEAATQALRGYVGNVRSVNRDIEQRADAALAKAQSLEAAVTDGERDPTAAPDTGETGSATASTGDTTERGVDATAGGATDRVPGSERANAGVNPAATVGTSLNGNGETPPEQGARASDRAEAGTRQADENTQRGTGKDTRAETSTHHCKACGRPTPGSDGHATGGRDQQTASHDGAHASAQTGTDALDPEFRAETETDDQGTFERIRRLL